MRKFKAVILAMLIMALCASCAAAFKPHAFAPHAFAPHADSGVNEEQTLIDDLMEVFVKNFSEFFPW